MIQLITTISAEISYYVTDNLSAKINTIFYEIQKKKSINIFNTINSNELETTKKAMINTKIVNLRLDYSTIDYVKTLAYALNVPESYIYDITYRRIFKNLLFL